MVYEPQNWNSGNRYFNMLLVWGNMLEFGFHWVSHGRLWKFDNDLDLWSWGWDIKYRFYSLNGHGGSWGYFNPTNRMLSVIHNSGQTWEYEILHYGGWTFGSAGLHVYHRYYVNMPSGGSLSNVLFNDKTIFVARYARAGRWKIGVWDYRYGTSKTLKIEWDFNGKPSCGAYWHGDRYRIHCIIPNRQVIVKEYLLDISTTMSTARSSAEYVYQGKFDFCDTSGCTAMDNLIVHNMKTDAVDVYDKRYDTDGNYITVPRTYSTSSY